MGNELADAIRAQLRAALLTRYGALDKAAEAMGTPYKRLYRNLTEQGKERTARVSLDFVLEVSAHLKQTANVDFAEIHRRAMLTLQPIGPIDVTPPSDDQVIEFHPREIPMAANKGTRKADAEPHAD